MLVRLPIKYVDAFSATKSIKWLNIAQTHEITTLDRNVWTLIDCDVPEAHELLEKANGCGKQTNAVKTILKWIFWELNRVKRVNIKQVKFLVAEEYSLVEKLFNICE